MSKTIHVAHSPDSDDAFMFYALAEGRVDTEGLTFDHELSDIESLNRRAMAGELDVTAVSFHAYAYLADFMPGPFRGPPKNLDDIVSNQYLGLDGMLAGRFRPALRFATRGPLPRFKGWTCRHRDIPGAQEGAFPQL